MVTDHRPALLTIRPLPVGGVSWPDVQHRRPRLFGVNPNPLNLKIEQEASSNHHQSVGESRPSQDNDGDLLLMAVSARTWARSEAERIHSETHRAHSHSTHKAPVQALAFASACQGCW